MAVMQKMDLYGVDLNLLLSLEVLLKEKHITRSADRLGISQPSMSRNLARLQRTFADPLLVRTPQGYANTPRAMELETLLIVTLENLQSIFTKQDFEPETASDVFKISTLDYGEAVIMPTLSQMLQKSAPLLELEVLPRDMYSVADLQSGAVDFSIGILPTSSTEGCIIKKLVVDRYVCAMCIDHPLAKQKLTMEKFLSYAHAVNMSSKEKATPIDDLMKDKKIERKIVRRSCHFFASLFSLKNTNMLHAAALLHVKILMKEQMLTFKELPFEAKPIQLYLMWHVRNNEAPSHKWLREQIFKAAGAVKKQSEAVDIS